MSTIYQKLLEVQKEIGAIKKDNDNPFFKSKYFDINSLLAAVKPVLNKHGLVLTQGLTNLSGPQGDSILALSTKITLAEENPLLKTTKEGIENVFINEIEYTCPLPSAPDAQKYGSAITYFRRYALQSLLALEAEDDDGQLAVTPKSGYEKKADVKERVAKTQALKDTNQDPF